MDYSNNLKSINKEKSKKISLERAFGIALVIPAVYYAFSFCMLLLLGDAMDDMDDSALIEMITMEKLRNHWIFSDLDDTFGVIVIGLMAVAGAYLLKGSDTKKSL